MRIKSNFRDYYDKGMKFGFDRRTTYIRYRKPLESPIQVLSGRLSSSCTGRQTTVYYNEVTIGFCGKIYNALDLEYLKFDYDSGALVSRDRNVSYSEEELAKFLEKALGQDRVESAIKTISNYHGRACWNYFEYRHKSFLGSLDIFTKYRAPIFVITRTTDVGAKDNTEVLDNSIAFCRESVMTLNSILKPLEFFRIFDTFSAYQEIEMFLGNLANPEPQMIETSDRTRLEAHGFDNKTSFRKSPSKKRR